MRRRGGDPRARDVAGSLMAAALVPARPRTRHAARRCRRTRRRRAPARSPTRPRRIRRRPQQLLVVDGAVQGQALRRHRARGACVENFTIDFYLRVSGRYVTNPYPGVSCPADPYDMDLRAEIWQYTPQTGRWRRVLSVPRRHPEPAREGQVRRPRHRLPRHGACSATARDARPLRRRRHRRRVPPRAQAQAPAADPVDADGRHFRATPVPERRGADALRRLPADRASERCGSGTGGCS